MLSAKKRVQLRHLKIMPVTMHRLSSLKIVGPGWRLIFILILWRAVWLSGSDAKQEHSVKSDDPIKRNVTSILVQQSYARSTPHSTCSSSPIKSNGPSQQLWRQLDSSIDVAHQSHCLCVQSIQSTSSSRSSDITNGMAANWVGSRKGDHSRFLRHIAQDILRHVSTVACDQHQSGGDIGRSQRQY